MPRFEVNIVSYSLDHALCLNEAARESVNEMQPWMPWCTKEHNIEAAESWIEKQIRDRENRLSYEFAIVDSEDNFLGGCGINQIDTTNKRANLGYWVRRTKTGIGVAPQAVTQLSEWIFKNTDIVRLEIVVAESNKRSQRVAEKVDAFYEGLQKKRLCLNDNFYDTHMYSIVRDD